MRFDHGTGRYKLVTEAELAQSQAYNHVEVLASFLRWGTTPIEVQQDIERCVRDDEVLRRRDESYLNYRAHRVDDHEAEYREAMSRSLKRQLRDIPQ